MTPSDVQHWKSKIPMIYINIESKKERNEHMKKTFSNLFGTIIRSEGVLRDNEEVKNLLTVMKDVDPNILAVTLSHLNAIKLAKKTITELNNPLIQHAVIMEDDADIILMPFWRQSKFFKRRSLFLHLFQSFISNTRLLSYIMFCRY